MTETKPVQRQRWLDAVRGLAVLAVVIDHLTYLAFPGTWVALMGGFHIGAFGAAVIFLVTGYVIPASLERGGNIGRFWVSRIFRLYPLWTVMAAGVVVLGLLGLGPLPSELWSQPGTVMLANATLLQSLIGVPPLLVVLWTLSFQMVFYLLVTVSFRLGVHRRNAEIAIALGVLALLITAFGRSLEPITLPHNGWFTAAMVAVVAAGLAAALHRARAVHTAGAIVLAVAVLALVTRDQHAGGWGVIILALLFTGSALYQARQGQTGAGRVVTAVVMLLAAAAAAAWGGRDPLFLQPQPSNTAAWAWLAAIGSGVLLIALAPLVRDRFIPPGLPGTGVVSYSVFLLHLGVIWMLLPWLKAGAGSWWGQILAAIGLIAVLMPGCYLTYRLVERPGQSIGRALLRKSSAPSVPHAEKHAESDDRDLTISVIIPSYNKAKTLAACLDSVYAQSIAAIEVIVVDDASTDQSRQIISGYPAELLAFDANRGPSAARNAGAATATGDVLFFLDADIALAPDAFASALRVLREQPQYAVVQGIYDWRPLVADGRVEEYKALSEHFWRRKDVGPSEATLFALTAIRRHAFDEAGGFDENLRENEDIEFGTRLPAHYGIWTSKEVIGQHDDVDRFWPYLAEHVRRARQYGLLLARLLLARRRSSSKQDSGVRRKGADVAAVMSMASCVLALLTLPLVIVSGWLLLAPLSLTAVFVLIDRQLFGFTWRRRGVMFASYVVAMQFLMYTTQLAGMLAGALSGAMKTLRRIALVVFTGLLVFGLFTVLREQDWAPLAAWAATLDTSEVVLTLTGAYLVNCLGLLFGVVSWRALFLDLGARVDTWTALRIFFVGFLTKFVPGRFVALPVLVSMGRAVNVGPVRLASVFVLSWSIVALTGMTVGLAAGPALAGVSVGWLLAAALPTIALFARPQLLNWGIRAGARVLRRPAPDIAASPANVRRAIGAQTLSWLISGHHLWLLAVAAGAPAGRSYLVCVAGFAVATVAGIVVTVAPDGIGVREAVLVVGLSSVMPVPVATTVVLASRVVSVLTDVTVGAAGLLVAQRLHVRRTIPAA